MNNKVEKKTWIIRWTGTEFFMEGPDQSHVVGEPHWKPRHFANHAWLEGADEVKHDYDCSLYGRD